MKKGVLDINLKTLLIILLIIILAVVLFTIGKKLFGSSENIVDKIKDLSGGFVETK